jgi:hypothetical protein
MFASLKRLFSAGNSRAAAAVLLGVSFAIGWTQLYWNNFIDEGDNLAGGVLLAHGQLLHRDVFSHHFPFPYYSVAAVARCCGESIFA